MLVGEIYERMGIGSAPKGMAQKPMLSVMLEKLGRLPIEDEVFVYEGMRITPKSVVDGKPLEVMVQLIDEEENDDAQASDTQEEVTV